MAITMDTRWRKVHLMLLLGIQFVTGVIQLALNIAYSVEFADFIPFWVYMLWPFIAITLFSTPLQALLLVTSHLSPGIMIGWYVIWTIAYLVGVIFTIIGAISTNVAVYRIDEYCNGAPDSSLDDGYYDSPGLTAGRACSSARLGIAMTVFPFIQLFACLYLSIFSCVMAHRSSVRRHMSDLSREHQFAMQMRDQQHMFNMQQRVPTEYYAPSAVQSDPQSQAAPQASVREFYSPDGGASIAGRMQQPQPAQSQPIFNPTLPFLHNGVIYKAIPVSTFNARPSVAPPTHRATAVAPIAAAAATAVAAQQSKTNPLDAGQNPYNEPAQGQSYLHTDRPMSASPITPDLDHDFPKPPSSKGKDAVRGDQNDSDRVDPLVESSAMADFRHRVAAWDDDHAHDHEQGPRYNNKEGGKAL